MWTFNHNLGNNGFLAAIYVFMVGMLLFILIWEIFVKGSQPGHIKQDLMKGYTGSTDESYCRHLYHMLQCADIRPNKIMRDLTNRSIHHMQTAVLYIHKGDQEIFYRELADFFRGHDVNDMKLPVTYTERAIFIMIYELGLSVFENKQ